MDLRRVQYLDSAAIAVLFANAKRIGLVRVHPFLMRALTISGLNHIVTIQPVDFIPER